MLVLEMVDSGDLLTVDASRDKLSNATESMYLLEAYM